MTVPLIGSCTLTRPLRSPEFPRAVVSGGMGQLLMFIIDTDALYGASVAVRSPRGYCCHRRRSSAHARPSAPCFLIQPSATPPDSPRPIPPHPPFLPPFTEDLRPPVTAAWRGSRPRQGEQLLLSRPRVHHFSFDNVPALVPGNPASKHRLCSHLLRNLVNLSTLLSPCASGCRQYCLLCSVQTRRWRSD